MIARRFAVCAAVVCCVPLLSGCVSQPQTMVTGEPQPPLQASAQGPTFSDSSSEGAVLRPDDRISLIVLREPDLSVADMRIADDGTVGVPYVGSVHAAGMTPRQLENDLEGRLSSYLVNPQVAVNVVSYDSHVVTVTGSVAQPGVYPFQKDTTLLGAIALAHGATRVANLRRVAVFRHQGGARSVAVFDLRQVQAGRMIDPVLIPGDGVVVGTSGLTQAWQDFLQAAPAIGIFTRF